MLRSTSFHRVSKSLVSGSSDTSLKPLDFSRGPEMMESGRSALATLHDASFKPDSLHGVPVVVHTREDVNVDEREQQRALSRLSSRATWEIAIGSSHFVQLDRPDLIIAAIEKIMHTVQ